MIKRAWLVLVPAALLSACTSNPTGPGTKIYGISAATDSTSYSPSSPVTVTIKNSSGSIGLFNSCGGRWDFVLQAKNNTGWYNVDGLMCLAIFGWTVVHLPADSSHSERFPSNFFSPSGHLSGTYRFMFHFSIFPDSSLSDSVSSNSFSVE